MAQLFSRREAEQWFLAAMALGILTQLFRIVVRMSWSQRIWACIVLYYASPILGWIGDKSDAYIRQKAYFQLTILAIVAIVGVILVLRGPRILRWIWRKFTGQIKWGGFAHMRSPRATAPSSNQLNIIVLSDHTADMANQAAQERRDDYDRSMAERQGLIDEMKTRREERRARLTQAWADRRIAVSILNAAWLGVMFLKPKPAEPIMRAADTEELKWASGRDGEQCVVDRWTQLFSNRWTLVCGYHNRAGEIDQILVGPGGIFAIEVKYINGKVSCNGDVWWRDKYDNYGNLVEQNVRIADRGGRSPSAQINAPAAVLQALLAKESATASVMRVVVLSHRKSQVGRLDNLSVSWAGTLDSFTKNQFAGSRGTQMDEATVQRVIALVRRDHAQHLIRRGAIAAVTSPSSILSDLSVE